MFLMCTTRGIFPVIVPIISVLFEGIQHENIANLGRSNFGGWAKSTLKISEKKPFGRSASLDVESLGLNEINSLPDSIRCRYVQGIPCCPTIAFKCMSTIVVWIGDSTKMDWGLYDNGSRTVWKWFYPVVWWCHPCFRKGSISSSNSPHVHFNWRRSHSK